VPYSFVPPTEFSEGWPGGVPVQIHGMDADPYFAGDGDIDAARAFMADASDAELFVYSGDGHLFADPSSPDFDPEAAALLTERVLRFLGDLR
jgi:dienelactone hydrolase